MPVSINGNTGVITGIAAGGLPDGCILDADINGMTASKLTGALPAISGASLTGISAGLTEADQFLLTSNLIVNATATTVTSNLARSSYSYMGANAKVGTGMSESSGVFTFPSTGKYLITTCASMRSATEGNYASLRSMFTVDDGSNWYYIAVNHTNIKGGGSSSNQVFSVSSSQALVDVTDVSTNKFRLSATSQSAMVVIGHASEAYTSVIFTKLGDT